MIKVEQSNKLLSNDILAFTISKEELSILEKSSLEKLSLFSFKFNSEVYSIEKKIFFRQLSELLISQYDLYYFFVEKTAKKRSPIRTYKKMMYPHRNQIGKDFLFEYEIELEKDRTILFSAILVDDSNVDYVCSKLLDSRFSFACLVNKTKNKKSILERILLKNYLIKKKSENSVIDLNILKIAANLVDDKTSIIRRSNDGLDNTYLSVFYQNTSHIEVMKSMRNKFSIRNV